MEPITSKLIHCVMALHFYGKVLTESWEKMEPTMCDKVRSFCVGEGPVLCFEVLGMKRMQAPKFPGTEKTTEWLKYN